MMPTDDERGRVVDVHGVPHCPQDLHAWLRAPLDPDPDREATPTDASATALAAPVAKMGLGAVMSLVFCVSAILAGVGAGGFWYGYQHHQEWMTECFSGKPLGVLEPFEAYMRMTSRENVTIALEAPNMIDGGREAAPEAALAEPDIEITPAASNLWERWMAAEYERQTGFQNPYEVCPNPLTPEEWSRRRQAFQQYREYSADNLSLSDAVMIQCFVFDCFVYLVAFFVAGAAIVMLVRFANS